MAHHINSHLGIRTSKSTQHEVQQHKGPVACLQAHIRKRTSAAPAPQAAAGASAAAECLSPLHRPLRPLEGHWAAAIADAAWPRPQQDAGHGTLCAAPGSEQTNAVPNNQPFIKIVHVLRHVLASPDAGVRDSCPLCWWWNMRHLY